MPKKPAPLAPLPPLKMDSPDPGPPAQPPPPPPVADASPESMDTTPEALTSSTIHTNTQNPITTNTHSNAAPATYSSIVSTAVNATTPTTVHPQENNSISNATLPVGSSSHSVPTPTADQFKTLVEHVQLMNRQMNGLLQEHQQEVARVDSITSDLARIQVNSSPAPTGQGLFSRTTTAGHSSSSSAPNSTSGNPTFRRGIRGNPAMRKTCLGCSGQHWLSECPTYRTISQRTTVLQAHERCTRCFSQHPGPCTQEGSCAFCGDYRHNTGLCPDQFD